MELLPKLEGLDVNEGGGAGGASNVRSGSSNNIPPAKPAPGVGKGGRKGGAVGETEGLLSESTLIGV